MAEENITIDLTSRADVSGFRKFEEAAGRTNQAKREGAEASFRLADSERRVKSAFEESIMYMGEAQNASEAVGQSLMHLTEAFQLGFAGSVIGGVAGAIIQNFGKAREEIEKLVDEVNKTGEALDNLERKVSGKQMSKSEGLMAELQKQIQAQEKEKDALQHPGFWGTIATGFQKMMGGDFGQKDAMKKLAEQSKKDQEIAAKIGEMQADEMAAPFQKQFAKFEKAAQKAGGRSGGMGLKEFGEEAEFQEQTEDLAKKAAVKTDKANAAAEKKQEAAQLRAEKAAESAAERQAKRDLAAESKSPKLHVVAGSQRAMGGGGGAYSIVEDPAVTELRKQTTLLQEIARNGKPQMGQPAPAALAA